MAPGPRLGPIVPSVEGARRIEELIGEAIARGDLTPTEGVGEPIRRLDADPDWWVRGLLTRESLPDRFRRARRDHAAIVAAAIAAEELAEARGLLAVANTRARRWNEEAPASHRLPERTEVWLLDRRAGRPAD